MKEVIPKNSRYVPIVQQRSCCVPACISMIIYKRGIPLVPQELLGYHLGLTVDKESIPLFWNPRTGKRPPSGYGTQIYKPQYHPNKVLPKLGIPLRMTYYPISDFDKKKFISFLASAVKEDKDVLVCFDHGSLTDGKPSGGGHVCVLDRYMAKEGKVRLVDPSANQPKWRVVTVQQLMKAMQDHTSQKSAGFWEFNLIK